MQTFHNILIVRTDRVGDVVLTTPAIKALRKAYPAARISLLISPATKDLVEGNPYIDEILVDDRKGRHKGLIGTLQLARDIRRRNFDIVFIFHTKRRYNLACFLAGVPVRLGYKNDKFGFLLSHPVKDVRHLGQKHEAQLCLDILKEIGVHETEPDFFVPINKEAESWAMEWLNTQGLQAGRWVAVHIGASVPSRSWPDQKFIELINSLTEKYDAPVVLIGTGDIKARCEDIVHLGHGKIINVAGQTSLAQMASLLRRCRVLISNDSGPVHVAAALGVHVISIFIRNDPDIPERWKPLSTKGSYLYSKQGVEVKEVLEEVDRIFCKDQQNFFHW